MILDYRFLAGSIGISYTAQVEHENLPRKFWTFGNEIQDILKSGLESTTFNFTLKGLYFFGKLM